MTDSDHDKWRKIPEDARESIWKAADGWEIRRIDFDPAVGAQHHGSILFLPGRGDHYEKYLETLDFWSRKGWRVTSIDWRGQGLSGRLLADPHIGHIDDFATWISDLGYFWAKWKESTPGPHIAIAHSMGGHLLMRALIEDVIVPDVAVLSAPMLGIQAMGLPIGFTLAYAKLRDWLGQGEKAAWKVSEKPMSAARLRQKLLTHDARRYVDELAWWEIRPGVKLGPPDWHWMVEAIKSIKKINAPDKYENLKIPVLLMATSSDKLVNTSWIKRASERLPKCELLLFGREAAHELLREEDLVRDKCLSAIDDFIHRHLTV
jgi:lysophospholipase